MTYSCILICFPLPHYTQDQKQQMMRGTGGGEEEEEEGEVLEERWIETYYIHSLFYMLHDRVERSGVGGAGGREGEREVHGRVGEVGDARGGSVATSPITKGRHQAHWLTDWLTWRKGARQGGRQAGRKAGRCRAHKKCRVYRGNGGLPIPPKPNQHADDQTVQLHSRERGVGGRGDFVSWYTLLEETGFTNILTINLWRLHHTIPALDHISI